MTIISSLRYVLCVLLTFQQVFNLAFNFMPIRIRTLMALIGGYWLYKDWRSLTQSKQDKRLWKKLFFLLAILVSVAFVTTILNFYFDPYFFKYPFSVFISLSSSYCFLVLFGYLYRSHIEYDVILKYIVIACLLQCIITVFFFIQPSIREFFYQFLVVSEMAQEAYDAMGEKANRFMGLGANGFTGGVILALAIFYTAILSRKSKSIIALSKYIILAIIITFVGSAIARTTLVGLVIFIGYIGISKSFPVKSKLFLGGIFLCLLVIAIWIYVEYVESDPLFEAVFQRAFSMFYVFQNTGEMQGAEDFAGEAVYPSTFMTWIIGDGKMADPKDPLFAYYMHVDIGVWRVIFGIGIIGLIIYSLIQLFLCKLTKLGKLEYTLLFFFYVACMFKGIISFDVFLSPLIMVSIYNNIRSNKIKEAMKAGLKS